MADDLWTVATLATRSADRATAAQYYEETANYKRAVELYHRAGQLHKAVEMAFTSQQPETLQVIAAELDANSDPDLVGRCAEFFLGIDQLQKAVNLLANTKQYERALSICVDRGVPVTETLAESLTPSKEEMADDQRRISILTQLGDILQQQGDYHTATKKFTQAGDRGRAMKCLLKSGDTEKIIFFAGMSRQRDVYIMAANYLQSLDWHNDAKVLRNIVTFYAKGQAYDLLANFYANCAQVEIDEYRDYEKALKALQEAARCLAKMPQQVQRAVEQVQVTVMEVRKVLELQQANERRDYAHAITMSQSILAHPEQRPVRHADIRAILVEALTETKQYAEALGVLRELALAVSDWSARGMLERSLIERLTQECNVDFDAVWNSGRQQRGAAAMASDGRDDEDEEEIQEVMD